MTTDFFVRLALATHKVAGMLQNPLRSQLKHGANKLLGSLVLLAKENPIAPEQKRSVAPKAIKDLGTLVVYLNYAKRTSEINPGNFLLLEKEYDRVGEFLRQIHEETHNCAELYAEQRGNSPQQANSRQVEFLSSTKELLSRTKEQRTQEQGIARSPREKTTSNTEQLSGRQARILELLRNKDKTQVWELQKVLPQVTKRTLRRDLDDLLKRNLIIRQGEWNEVFYRLTPG